VRVDKKTPQSYPGAARDPASGRGLERYVMDMVGVADLVTGEAIQYLVPKAPGTAPMRAHRERRVDLLTRCWISFCLLTCR
jgi:hypothetical protein